MSALLRGGVLILVVLALAGPEVSTLVPGVNVLYLLDVSDSMDLRARERGLEAIRIMSTEAETGDLSAWGVFGRDLRMERSFDDEMEAGVPESITDGRSTDLEQALVSAMGIFPDRGEKRIVLLTDGIETRGDALSAAGMLRQAGITVYPVAPAASARPEEVYISSLEAPSTVRRNEPHRVTVHVSSSVETAVRILFSRDGEYIGEETVNLVPGGRSFSYTSLCEEKGLHVYGADIFPAVDAVPDNNSRRAVVRVEGEPGVLLVRSGGVGPSPPAEALEAQGIGTTVCAPPEIPSRPEVLSRYDAVILENVPAYDLSYETMEALESYVRRGGGFLMTGGPDSFGAGGYFSTPVEKLLPVSMDVTSRLDLPPVSVVMLIDKSGSMGGEASGGATKLDLVKEAVLAAVEVLNPFYQIGVCAFDANVEWTVPLTEAGRRDEIETGVGTLSPGGGTRLYPALQEAFRAQAGSESAVRHIIVLSDGQTDTADFGRLTRHIAETGITVSTVGVGEDADRALLEEIALFGRGRSYYTDNPGEIPSIFVTESMIVSRNLIVEEPFIPTLEGSSDMVRGLDPQSFPPLGGFVLTYLKEHAEELLGAPEDYPLLAVRQYGLGRSAAFTSDLAGRWSREFLAWKSFPVFISQVVRGLFSSPGSAGVRAEMRPRDDTIDISVDVLAPDESFINFLELRGIASGTLGSEREIVLDQTAPGRYTGTIPSEGEGIYTITLYESGGTEGFPLTTVAAAVPYPEEFVPGNPDPLLLSSLAEATGGRMTDPFTEGDTGIYEPADDAPGGYRPIAVFLVLSALLLFLADLGFRYLSSLRGAGTSSRRRRS